MMSNVQGAEGESSPDANETETSNERVALWQKWNETKVHWREPLVVIALIVVADMTIYRGYGYAGYALLFLTAPVLMLVGALRPRFSWATLLTLAFLGLTALRLVWCGSWLNLLAGAILLPTLTMAMCGSCPYVPELIAFASHMMGLGYRRIACYADALRGVRAPEKQPRWIEVMLPCGALLLFSLIFIMANPMLIDYVSGALNSFSTALNRWFSHFSILEIMFWMLSGWIGFGLLRPKIEMLLPESLVQAMPLPQQQAPLYRPLRNTLITVTALFTVYLLFEFATLWFREFPKGFYYAGYAHQGAAWLTIALALATASLSWIFRGSTLADPRLPQLKWWAWLWSAQNFVLALSVFNRMHIYIDFNGMTRMRTIGLFGITTVVVGFILVLVKIAKSKGFLWLIRRQLWALSLAAIIYSITPVDMLIHRYNVARIMEDQLAPSVQISVHDVSAEGYLAILPLIESDNTIISNGIKAILCREQIAVAERMQVSSQLGWTTFQASDRMLFDELKRNEGLWNKYIQNPAALETAIEEFNAYVYQWY